MTLIIAATSPQSIWAAADRRLTFGSGGFKDNARKIMFLETRDGVAILGYAGLGRTAGGVEPSEWMSNVLRGVNAPLEQLLVILTNAVATRLPPHLQKLPHRSGKHHVVLIPALCNGSPRLYSIEVDASNPSLPQAHFRSWSGGSSGARSAFPPRLAVAGSGSFVIARSPKRGRQLLNTIRAFNSGRIAGPTAAADFARLIKDASLHERSVGPDSIVAWRVRGGGGAHQAFAGGVRDGTPSLPTLAAGMDVRALGEAVLPIFMRAFGQGTQIPAELDTAAIEEALRRLPDRPDDTLP